MKILHFGKHYPPFLGGVEKVNYDLVEMLNQKEDCHVDELCFCHKVGYEEVFRPEGYKLFRVPIRGIKFSTPIPSGLLKTYRKIKDDYDIVHIHVPNPVAVMALLLLPSKAKIAIHWHSDIVKQKQLLRLFKPFQNALLKRASVIFATSKNYAEHSADLSSFINKVVIDPIGLNKDEMIYTEDGVAEIKRRYDGKKIVLCIGRLTSYKGHKYLVDAAKQLDEDTVVLVGGVGELEEDIKSQIKSNKLEEKVQMIGRIPQDKIYAYYKAADVFCLPSITKAEAFGVVLVEALAMGTPIVTCDIEGSGVPWVNENGVTGYNVPVCNSDELASAINKILNDDDLRKKMSENCVKRFERLFTRGDMVKKVYEAYLRILKKS